jgi:hypothetical protein
LDSSNAARLLGTWRLLRADPALDFAPGVRMRFRDGGQLEYSFDSGTHRQVVKLLYRLVDDQLHTEHPESGHGVVARCTFGAGDVLVFDFSGASAWFVRELESTSWR